MDKGATVLADAIATNKVLKELNVSRCSIGDIGGAAIAQALSGGSLVFIDLSWNALR